jgi:HK97 family phage major capsid protein
MNIETRERYLKQCADKLEKRINACTTKTQLKALQPEVERLHDAWTDWQRQRDIKSSSMYSLMRNGGDAGEQPEITTRTLTGRELAPLSFSEASLKAMYKAYLDRQPFTIRAETKAFSTVDSLLPPQLDPYVVEEIHEWRILDRLPCISITAPSWEYITHNFASDTGGPGIVAEGGTKPEYVPAATSSTVSVEKLAFHTGISYETLADWPQWLSYVQAQSYRLMADYENQQLLNGTGNLTGFFQTSGILSHNCANDASSWTAIDSIEAAITQMRVGTALSEPDLFITHPTTWASIRRTKTTTNAYVVGDPLREPVSTIWNVPVLITTACTNGQGLLLDTTKFGKALIREGIVMHQGYSGTDFVQNIARYVFEERLTLAVERPQSVLAITNLPTA